MFYYLNVQFQGQVVNVIVKCIYINSTDVSGINTHMNESFSFGTETQGMYLIRLSRLIHFFCNHR